MIDLLLAEKNISKYKFDYSGYLVIIDRIRTKEVIENGMAIWNILLIGLKRLETSIIKIHQLE